MTTILLFGFLQLLSLSLPPSKVFTLEKASLNVDHLHLSILCSDMYTDIRYSFLTNFKNFLEEDSAGYIFCGLGGL